MSFSDAKKIAYMRRQAVKRLSRTVATLSVEDIKYLQELAQRLVERAAKPVLPNSIEELARITGILEQ